MVAHKSPRRIACSTDVVPAFQGRLSYFLETVPGDSDNCIDMLRAKASTPALKLELMQE